MANTTRCTWTDIFGEVETQLHKDYWISQLDWKSESFNEGFLWLTWFWLFWVLGTMALKDTPDIGNYPTYNNHSSFTSMLYSLKSFKWMFTALITNQKISLRLEYQKGNEENDQLKECEPNIITWIPQRDSAKISKNSTVVPYILISFWESDRKCGTDC